jgi:hypothetical protein
MDWSSGLDWWNYWPDGIVGIVDWLSVIFGIMVLLV